MVEERDKIFVINIYNKNLNEVITEELIVTGNEILSKTRNQLRNILKTRINETIVRMTKNERLNKMLGL